MSAYKIIGKHQGETEVIDTAENKAERDYMLTEYRMAFGQGWTIWSKPIDPTREASA